MQKTLKPLDFDPRAKVCLTSSGLLIHEQKILLIKHKKLGLWMSPGGHIEQDELPHEAAEREFWEETGMKVRAIPFGVMIDGEDSMAVPSPILTDLHWVSKKNYQARVEGDASLSQGDKFSARGCEQHLCFVYLMEPVEGLEFTQNVEETDGIAWFTEAELDEIETSTAIRLQGKEVLRLRRV